MRNPLPIWQMRYKIGINLLDNPEKEFFLLDEGLCCYDMKLTTLKDVYEVLENETNEVNVEESVRTNAYKALDTMLKLS